MQITRAGIEHKEAIAVLFDLYRQFYGQDANMSVSTDFIQQRLNNQDSTLFFATDDDSQAAMGFVQLYPSFSSVSAERSLILNDLYVRKEFRTLGVAKALMNTARQYAEQTGARGLSLSTQIENTKAQALYEQLGYQRDEDFFHYFLRVN